MAPRRSIRSVTFLVRDYDDALGYFTGALGFALIEDTPLPDGKRWVLVAPSGTGGSALLLAKAANEEQLACVGRQGGGRVFLFLETDDFARDHATMRSRGVAFLEQPREEVYGTVAVFRDIYGNKWDLLQPAK